MPLQAPLTALADYNQFILWEAIKNPNGSIDKRPLEWRTLQTGDPHDPNNWLDARSALQLADNLGDNYGAGFVLTDQDPFFFVDLDDCAVGVGSGWNQFATEVYQMFPGAASVISSSQRGLHIIGRGKAPPGHRCKTKGLEVYTSKRFIALSPHNAVGDASTDHTPALHALIHKYLPPKEDGATDWTTEPVSNWTGPVDDNELIEKACKANSGAALFSGKATFYDLWTANAEVLGNCYPDPKGMRAYDASSADAALAAHLAFWTGKNCERISRLMRMSALVRDKWDERGDYLVRTITEMASNQTAVYDFQPLTQPTQPMPAEPLELGSPFRAEPERVTGYQFMTVEQQLLYFAGCAYVTSDHRVWTPQGQLLKPEQFKALYGGFEFALDATQNKTTSNAFQAFSESRALRHPKVMGTRFNPLVPPGSLIDENQLQYINSYRPCPGNRVEGNAAPFLDHISRLLPVPEDQEIILSYLAACVQMVGTKIQWCVVLQGTEGNGKSALYKALEYAIGTDHCFQLNPADVTNKFNGWLPGKLLVGIEELWMGGRAEFANAIKPMITNERVAVQKKGQDQSTEDNFANFIAFSNHRDAVVKNRNDRRYCVFYTAQQSLADLRLSGMDDEYFSRLYDYLRGDGKSFIAKYLSERPITVNVYGRAPNTSSTEAVIEQSMGIPEQVLAEALELEEPGFCGDLICSRSASAVLKAGKCESYPRATSRALRGIGYVLHPTIKNSKIWLDGIRRRVYVKEHSEASRFTNPEQIRQYWTDNQPGGGEQ
jgi:hypothetical protein